MEKSVSGAASCHLSASLAAKSNFTVERVVAVLLPGDYLYTKALNSGLFGINPGLELTYIDNLPRFIEVSCNMNMLSF